MMPVLPYLAPSRPNPLAESGKRVTVSNENAVLLPGADAELPTEGRGRLVMSFTVGEGLHGAVSCQSHNQRSDNIQDGYLYCEIGFSRPESM